MWQASCCHCPCPVSSVHSCDKSHLISHSFVHGVCPIHKSYIFIECLHIYQNDGMRTASSQHPAPVGLVNFIYWSRLTAKNRKCFDPKADDNDWADNSSDISTQPTQMKMNEVYSADKALHAHTIHPLSLHPGYRMSRGFSVENQKCVVVLGLILILMGSSWSSHWKQNNKFVSLSRKSVGNREEEIFIGFQAFPSNCSTVSDSGSGTNNTHFHNELNRHFDTLQRFSIESNEWKIRMVIFGHRFGWIGRSPHRYIVSPFYCDSWVSERERDRTNDGHPLILFPV